MTLVFCLIAILSLTTLMKIGDPKDLLNRVHQLRNENKLHEAMNLLDAFIRDGGESAVIDYEAACFAALLEARDSAFAYLSRAVEHGWLELAWMQEDEDLTSLRDDPRWSPILEKTKAVLEAKLAILPSKREKENPFTLPSPTLRSTVSIEETLSHRRSVRSYAAAPLTLQEASQLLWAAYGVTNERLPERLRGGFKAAPSAGACYPLELYLAAWEVIGLEPGYYLYEPWGHRLFPVRPGNYRDELGAACHHQGCVVTAPAALIWSAVYTRNTQRYGSRGRERYVCMDLGHSAENVYLQVESMGLGTVGVGAFDDLPLRLTVSMTREEEPLYVMPLGRKPVSVV